MKIFFTVADEWRNARRDVVLQASPEATTEDLIRLIEGTQDVNTTWRIGEHSLIGDERILETICDGAVLARGTSRFSQDAFIGQQAIEVRVVGGPEAGKSWRLPHGEYVVGRANDADLALSADRQASRRHGVLTVSDTGVTIRDEASSNGVIVNGVQVKQASVGAGEPIQIGESILAWSSAPSSEAVVVPDGQGAKTFNRPPRIIDPPIETTVTFPGEVPERQKSPLPIIGIIAPVAIGILMAVLLKRPEFLLFTLLSPVMAVSNHISGNRRGKGTYRSRIDEYEQALDRSRQIVAQAIRRESTELRTKYPDPAEVSSIASGPEPRLWERRRRDSDFLILRIGLTDLPAAVKVQGTPPTSDEAQPTLHQVPATIDLTEVGILGVAGVRASCDALARWFVSQAATFHAPDDLVITILTGAHQEQSWSWVRWLPHIRPEGSDCIARIGNSDASVIRLASDLAALVDERLVLQGSSSLDSPDQPAHLVVLDGAYRLGSIPALTRVLRRGPSVGIYCICIDDSDRLLPEECQASAVFSTAEPTRLAVRTSRSAASSNVLADLVSPDWGEDVARSLAPLRLNRRVESAAVLPSSLRLLEMLNLDSPTAPSIVKYWQASGRTTSALIGASVAGPLALDLSSDGPHGLVAGTTGSGKSEFLQTLIASLAVVNRPDAMNFVLVDYKGGSAFKDCAELPHTVGMVTDLDGHLTERALASLSSELRRREHLLQRTGTKDIEEYWRATDRVDAERLARLVIVIDEFAAMVEELPAFVEGLVDLARRGRSLGINLVLATQRPSGVVSPAIKTNTNLRIAMRVTDAADSVDVIDSPLASRIGKDAPGRGYLRVGHEHLTEFQAARVGGRRSVSSATDLELSPVSWEQLGDWRSETDGPLVTSEATDLSELVRAIQQASEEIAQAPVHTPWLDPLPELVELGALANDIGGTLSAIFGLEDRPDIQSQRPAIWSIEQGGHLLVAGDAGSGRSTFLRTLSASIGSRCSARDVHIFGIDCGNGALLPLIDLPHCGAVVSRTEVDRVDRLIDRLLSELTRRQQLLSLGGFSSIADQRAASEGEDRLPYVVVLVDRWEGFVAEFDSLDAGRLVSSFLHLMKEAPGVGIRVVVTGDRSALSARFSALVESTVLLRMNDRSNYSMAGLNPRKLPDHVPPGRGFRGGTGIELQVALLDSDPSGPSQRQALRAIAEDASAREPTLSLDELPEPIEVLPTAIRASDVLSPDFELDGVGPCLLVGVGGDRIGPRSVDLGVVGPGFIVGGPPRSGRSNALAVMARNLMRQQHEIIVITCRPSPLSLLSGSPGIVDVLDGRAARPENLQQAITSSRRPLAIFVDDAENLADAPIAELLTSFARSARDHGNALILAGTTAELSSGFRGFTPEVRKSKAGLLLCPSSPTDGELLGTRLPRTAIFPGPPGRGLLITQGESSLVQTFVDEAINWSESL